MEETLLERQAVEIELYKRLVAKQDKIINDLKIQITLKDDIIALKDETINFKTAVIAELKDMVNEACDIGDRQIKERAIR